mgnify:FL=1
MPETPFEFLTDTGVIIARVTPGDVDTFVAVGGTFDGIEMDIDVRIAVTKILLQETHVIET